MIGKLTYNMLIDIYSDPEKNILNEECVLEMMDDKYRLNDKDLELLNNEAMSLDSYLSLGLFFQNTRGVYARKGYLESADKHGQYEYTGKNIYQGIPRGHNGYSFGWGYHDTPEEALKATIEDEKQSLGFSMAIGFKPHRLFSEDVLNSPDPVDEPGYHSTHKVSFPADDLGGWKIETLWKKNDE
jgi:hypothetical protein